METKTCENCKFGRLPYGSEPCYTKCTGNKSAWEEYKRDPIIFPSEAEIKNAHKLIDDPTNKRMFEAGCQFVISRIKNLNNEKS